MNKFNLLLINSKTIETTVELAEFFRFTNILTLFGISFYFIIQINS